MTAFKRGDIVLVSFVFADEHGAKRRPGLVLSTEAYHTARREAILAAITSNTHRVMYGDALIHGWEAAGLRGPSVLTCIVRTIKQSMIADRLGELPEDELAKAGVRLREAMGLQNPRMRAGG